MSDINDPFKSDATVMRPRPGAGRRGAGDPMAPPAPPRVAQPDLAGREVPEPLVTGLNPLVQSASSLLRLAGQVRGTLSAPEVSGLRASVNDEIRRFEERARAASYSNEVVLAARYVLCAAVDEAVLSTPWGAQSDWAQQTLLIALHGEAWGGERFFEMLDRISDTPDRHIDLMELQYLCLALGFEGRYQVQDRGHAKLAEIQQKLYSRIRSHRGPAAAELAIRWKGLEDRRNPIIRYVPWWVAGAAAVAIVSLVFVVYYTRLARAAGPVQEALAAVGPDASRIPAPVARGPRLKPLLAADEASGTVSVEEDDGRTLVTLLTADLFASGSATVNPAARPTLERLAAALDRVPGRVFVVGHTDDQPLRSFAFATNVELSVARAKKVAEILGPLMRDPVRITAQGVGSTDPRYTPESTPENRARNRRVEIIHVAGW